MQISVTGRHFETTDALRQHIETKIRKLDRFLDEITDVNVVLSVEKYRHIAEITLLQAKGSPIRSLEETHDMYQAVDLAIDKLEKQARKRNKKRDTARKNRAAAKQSEMIIEEDDLAKDVEISTPPKVIRSKRIAIKPMSVDEAAMQMGLIHDDFLAFLNSETEQMNVMYKRKDGNYGLIEPEF